MRVDVKLDGGPILAYETAGLFVQVGDRVEVPARPYHGEVEQGEVISHQARYNGPCKQIRCIVRMAAPRPAVPQKRRWENVTVFEAIVALTNELGRTPSLEDIAASGLGRYLVIRKKDFRASRETL